MAELDQPILCDLVITRHCGSITADHVLRQVIDLNAKFIQVAFYLVPIGRLAQVLQQMAQPVVTQIQRHDDLRGQAAQGVVHALEVGCHRYFPVVAFRDDIRQPNHRCPPPTEPPLRPMARDMAVQDLRQAHLHHLPNEQGHIVDALCDHHQVACPQDLLGLLRQLHSHGTLLPHAGAAWERAYQLHAMGSKYCRPPSQAPQKFTFGTFYTANGEIYRYQGEYRGLVNYYGMAQNLAELGYIRWTMETSLLKTLACKNQTSVMKETKCLQSTIETPEGPRKCLKLVIQREKKKPLVAMFGGLPLKRRKNPPIEDRVILPYARITSEIVERLLNDTCEVCGSKENVEMHHVRHLKDLNKKGKREMPLWMKIMISRKRKSIPLCRRCHDDIHHNRPESKRQGNRRAV